MTSRVVICGVGATPVGEHWSMSLADLGVTALRSAFADAGSQHVDAIVIGNMLSGVLNRQENLGAFIADRAGLAGVTAFKVEAACASGAAALQVGVSLIRSRAFQRVAVLGLEKMTDAPPQVTTTALGYATDCELESLVGATFPALAALVTSLYAEAAGVTFEDLFKFSQLAHHNAIGNPLAHFRRAVTIDDWRASPRISSPLRQLDCPSVCDGAAAVILSPFSDHNEHRYAMVEVAAIEAATELLPLSARAEPLRLSAAERSAQRAFHAARITVDELDFCELHDAFPALTALSLEAIGLAPRGRGWTYFDPQVQMPAIQTLGGLKGRGHPVGATGVYQIVESVLQLQGRAGSSQIPSASLSLAQSFGGLAANVYTTILRTSGKC